MQGLPIQDIQDRPVGRPDVRPFGHPFGRPFGRQIGRPLTHRLAASFGAIAMTALLMLIGPWTARRNAPPPARPGSIRLAIWPDRWVESPRNPPVSAPAAAPNPPERRDDARTQRRPTADKPPAIFTTGPSESHTTGTRPQASTLEPTTAPAAQASSQAASADTPALAPLKLDPQTLRNAVRAARGSIRDAPGAVERSASSPAEQVTEGFTRAIKPTCFGSDPNATLLSLPGAVLDVLRDKCR